MAAAVLVVGDVMTDVVVQPEGPVVLGADRRAAIRTLPGGSGANQAAWLAMQGVRTRFAGRVGVADEGEQERLLRAAGVEPVLAADPDLPTGTIVTLLSEDGERSFLTDRGANERLGPRDLPGSLLDGIDHLHVSGYSLFRAGPRAAVLELVAAAGARGVPVSIDPGSHSFLEEAGPENFLSWTGGVQICVPNAVEAAILAGTDSIDDQLDRLLSHYPVVVIKRGAKGAVAAAAGEGRFAASAPRVVPVDTTGAGDAFLAAFLAGYLAGEGIGRSLEHAVAAGTAATTRLGGRPSCLFPDALGSGKDGENSGGGNER